MRKIISVALVVLMVLSVAAVIPGVTAQASGARVVSSWDQLREAISDASVTEIVLGGDITRTGNASNHLPIINRSLTIDGAGHTLSFGNDANWAFRIGRRNVATNLTIENLTVANTRAHYFIISTETTSAVTNSGTNTGNWNVTLRNVSASGTTSAEMIKAQDSLLTLAGTVNWHTNSSRNSNAIGSSSGMVVVGGITITDNARVTLRGIHRILNVNAGNRIVRGINITGNAQVRLYNASKAPTIRLRGNNNSLNVTGGGQLFVTNAGDRKARNKYNTGVLLRCGTNGHIVVSGAGSHLEIHAAFGPAVRSKNSTLNVSQTEGANFIAHGRTKGKKTGTFDGKRIHFVVDTPGFFDFANWRPKGGLIIGTCKKNSSYTHMTATLDAWRRGTNLNNPPTDSWEQLFDFRLSGKNMKNFVSSSDPNFRREFNLGRTGKKEKNLKLYSRIGGFGFTGDDGYEHPGTIRITTVEGGTSPYEISLFEFLSLLGAAGGDMDVFLNEWLDIIAADNEGQPTTAYFRRGTSLGNPPIQPGINQWHYISYQLISDHYVVYYTFYFIIVPGLMAFDEELVSQVVEMLEEKVHDPVALTMLIELAESQLE